MTGIHRSGCAWRKAIVIEGTYSHPNGTTEGNAVTITLTKITEIKDAMLDLVNLTKNTTIKVYVKIDGTNYRLVDTYFWTTADADGLILTLPTHNHDIKITLKSSESEGASRNVPFSYVREEKE